VHKDNLYLVANLKPVAERVVDEQPVDACDLRVVLVRHAGRGEPGADLVEVRRDEPGVRLARGGERVLDADVELLGARPEPAAAAGANRLRLRHLLHPEQAAGERSAVVVAPARRRDLDVVDPENRHPRTTTISGWRKCSRTPWSVGTAASPPRRPTAGSTSSCVLSTSSSPPRSVC